MTTEVFAFRLLSEDVTRLSAMAKQTEWRTSAKLLRHLVTQQLGGASMRVPEEAQQTLSRKGPSGRLSVRLPATDVAAAKEIAAAYGGLTPWVRGLIQAHLGLATELPAVVELEALYAATIQLWHIGNNLNQAVHRLNEAHCAGLPMPSGAVTPALLEKVIRAIDVVATRNEAVIIAGRKRGNQRA